MSEPNFFIPEHPSELPALPEPPFEEAHQLIPKRAVSANQGCLAAAPCRIYRKNVVRLSMRNFDGPN